MDDGEDYDDGDENGGYGGDYSNDDGSWSKKRKHRRLQAVITCPLLKTSSSTWSSFLDNGLRELTTVVVAPPDQKNNVVFDRDVFVLVGEEDSPSLDESVVNDDDSWNVKEDDCYD